MLRIAILHLLFASALCAEEPTRLELKTDELPTASTYWYGVYMQGAKVGWLREDSKRAEDGKFVVRVEMRMQMQADGVVLRMHMSEQHVFDAKAPYRLFSAVGTDDMGDGVTTTSLERTDKGFAVTMRAGGEARTKQMTFDYTLADHVGSEIWLRRGGRKVGDRITTRSLDLDELAMSADTFVIKSIQSTLVRGVRQRLYVGELSSSTQGELGTIQAATNGRMISIKLGEALEMRREPEAVAKKLDAPIDMYAMLQVAVDKPLGDPSTISALVLEASGEGVSVLKNGPRQSVVAGKDPKRATLRVGAKHGVAVRATESEIQKATKATREYPADEARIVALAKRAVGDATDPREKTKRLVSFVDTYVEDEYGPEYSDALAVMRAKRGDCGAHAMLFVALARAAGIPAREVSGYMYIGDEERAFGGHAWCEVVLDGHWVEVDPTWNEVDINATHLSFRGPGADMDLLKAGGKLKLRVLGIERK